MLLGCSGWCPPPSRSHRCPGPCAPAPSRPRCGRGHRCAADRQRRCAGQAGQGGAVPREDSRAGPPNHHPPQASRPVHTIHKKGVGSHRHPNRRASAAAAGARQPRGARTTAGAEIGRGTAVRTDSGAGAGAGVGAGAEAGAGAGAGTSGGRSDAGVAGAAGAGSHGDDSYDGREQKKNSHSSKNAEEVPESIAIHCRIHCKSAMAPSFRLLVCSISYSTLSHARLLSIAASTRLTHQNYVTKIILHLNFRMRMYFRNFVMPSGTIAWLAHRNGMLVCGTGMLVSAASLV